jgi:hypothetical protein
LILRIVAASVALVFAGVVGACTLLDSPSQCATDGDCARFAARCDLAQGICAPLAGATGATGSGDGSTTAAPLPDDVPLPPECNQTPKPIGNPSAGLAPLGVAAPDGGAATITTALTLGCDKDWLLEGHLVVPAGATLTIAAGTTIKAKPGTNAAIVVQKGGRILANGQRSAPVVMTVDSPAPNPGDWRGLFVLGNGPRTGNAPYEDDPLLSFGGEANEDDSGVLSFVRLEYSAKGLVLGALGSNTRIDSVEVRRTADNCFSFLGGTASASHLVCQQPADDHFELADGYTGRLQHVFGLGVADGDRHHGMVIEGGGTAPVLYNVTLAGRTPATTGQSYAIVVRNGGRFDANNLLLTGWFGGLDVTGAIGTPIALRGSIAFANRTNPAHVEDGGAGTGPIENDDNGFDEVGFFRNPENANQETDPKLVDGFAATAPKPWPQAALTTGARTPPAGFDPAAHVGAFKDATDDWLSGWTRFDAR